MSTAQLIAAAAVTGLVVGLAGVIASSVVIGAPAAQVSVLEGRIAVADAGSTHTDFYLYKWQAPCSKCNETAVYGTFGEQLPFECSLKPGISSLTPAEVTAVIRTCLDQAAGNLSASVRSSTPFMLRATAGMRLLNFSNESKSDAVLQAVVDATKGTSFSNAGTAAVAEILSGEDEGAFSWATANYLEGTLHTAVDAVRESGPLGATSLATVAALDLGGASTQITFVPAEGAQWDPADRSTLRLYGEELDLYTHSYICYGQQRMTERRRAFLLNATGANDPSVVDPCFPVGYTSYPFAEDNLTAIAESPCVEGMVTIDVAALVGKPLTGGGDAEACNATMADLFEGSAVASAALPPAGNKFVDAVQRQPALPDSPVYAFSTYWYAANFLFPARCTEDAACNPSLAEFASAAVAACGKNLTTLQEEHPGVKEQYLVEYCQNTLYIVGLLERYGMGADDTNVQYVSSIMGTDVGWSFGYSLNSSAVILPVAGKEAAASEASERSAAKGGLAVSAIVIIASGIALLVVRRRLQAESRYSVIAD